MPVWKRREKEVKGLKITPFYRSFSSDITAVKGLRFMTISAFFPVPVSENPPDDGLGFVGVPSLQQAEGPEHVAARHGQSVSHVQRKSQLFYRDSPRHFSLKYTLIQVS